MSRQFKNRVILIKGGLFFSKSRFEPVLSKLKIPLLFATVTGIIYGCIQPFTPPEVNSPISYLVVDGFLNVGQDTSFIQLRRTQNINDYTNPIIESGAVLSVESEDGETYAFSEPVNGTYILPPNQFSATNKYRLRIQTLNGQEYLSEYVSVTVTPPIDSITYGVNEGLNAMVFFANTHDPKNQTHFYRWKFEETWAYRAAYASNLEVVNGQVVTREQDIYTCWQTYKSSNILLGSTIKLASDIIKDLPVNTVQISTNKLYIRYSILLKQYALSREAFEYWTTLSKTTQLTGSLFDPLPSLLTGNIRNTAANSDLVFGYFSASTEEEKRIVITPNLGSFPNCMAPDTIPVRCGAPDVDCASKTTGLLLNYYGMRSDSVLVTSPSCADCRLQGGTTKRPSFMN